ncbi:cyclase family protein [Brevibacterium daeguense]|uniref:Cyclase family protein n=1 Tax=Brevibacterium daeguense TaxID=909936 RepID=A0ABP8EFC1_9MICO|nr:cyclase family protein [Brevibacterium daeguense]
MSHQFTVAKSPWGPDDEMGALNLITPESRAAIMSRVDGSRTFDLSTEYFVGMPTWSALGDPSYQIYKTHDPAGDVVSNPAGLDDEANRLTSYTGDAISLYTHSGTHIDALNHFGCHGEIFNGYHADEHVGNRTWDKCGVDTIPPVIARGIMFDIAALKGVDQLPPSYGVGPEDLEAAAERQGVTVQEGDVVVVRTGRYREWPDVEAFLTDEPGLNLEGATWLAERGAMIVGADNVALEQLPSESDQTWCPVHLYLFNERGIPIIEVVNCEELSAEQVYEFAFIGLHLKLRGASASPIRCIAMALRD